MGISKLIEKTVGRSAAKARRNPKRPAEKLAAVMLDHEISLVLDVGGNHGQTGVELRKHGYSGRIVSFEPLPSAHALLSKAAVDDPLWDVAPRMAIGAEAGEITIRESEASDLSSIMPATAEMQAAFKKAKIIEEVATPIATLDSLFDTYAQPSDRVLVKIDTQGFEKAVLDGAVETLSKVVGIKIELSLFPLYEGETVYLELLNRLHGLGFEPYMLTETNFSAVLRRQLQIDAVMFRPDP